MTKGGPHTTNYRPDIDGLRAVAVLSVLGFHFFPGFLIPGGFAGVDIFFVISGFLISGIILDDLAESKFSFLKFYARRIRRLFPALALVLLFTFVIGWLVLFPEEYKALGKHISGGAGFISNILFWRESGYFDAEAATKPLLHLWSLGIEEQFYIFFPLLLCFFWKKGFREIVFIALLLVGSLVYNFHLEDQNQTADFYSPLSRFWELLIGAVLACLKRSRADSWPRRTALKINAFLKSLIYENPERASGFPLNSLLSATGIMMIAYAFLTFRNPPVWPGHLAIFPSMGAALILAAGMDSFLNRHLLGNRLAVGIGLISYPLYLWHWPIISYLRIVSGSMPDRATRIVATLIALLLAWLTYKFVERPFRFGLRFRTLKTLSLGIMMAVAAMAGLIIYGQDGLPGRSIQSPDYEVTSILADEACIAYVGIPQAEVKPYFCRLSNGHGASSVALIGDSHARSAYFGIEAMNSSIGLNTLLVATTVERLGSILYGHTTGNKEQNQKFLDRLSGVLKRSEIKAVFILIAAHNVTSNVSLFQSSLQLTIDTLNAAGKKVFIIIDWPALPKQGIDYMTRPYSEFFNPNLKAELQQLERDDLLKVPQRPQWQKYFPLLQTLKNATIIDGTWDAFCPDTKCQVFSEAGHLLYADSHHLTYAGSEFLVEKVLAPYLKEIAAAQ